MWFYQFSFLKTHTAASAIRAAWSTVSNWRFWFDFLEPLASVDPRLPLVTLSYPYASPTLWDHSPFAFNSYKFFNGVVCHGTVDLSSPILSIRFFLLRMLIPNLRLKLKIFLLYLLNLSFILITHYNCLSLRLLNKKSIVCFSNL